MFLLLSYFPFISHVKALCRTKKSHNIVLCVDGKYLLQSILLTKKGNRIFAHTARAKKNYNGKFSESNDTRVVGRHITNAK